MKKRHGFPARGSYKEAKMIQEKKKLKSFFNYSQKEKEEMITAAVMAAAEEMNAAVRHYNEKMKKLSQKNVV